MHTGRITRCPRPARYLSPRNRKVGLDSIAGRPNPFRGGDAFPSGHDGARPYGYGRVSTDTAGRYAIETVLPGSFKGPGGETYAPQISVPIFARGLLKALHTRVFLAPLELVKDDPLARAIGDPARLRTLITTRDPKDPKIYRWDVRLRGAGEAVFIEF